MTDPDTTRETYERIADDYLALHGDERGERETGCDVITALLADFTAGLPDGGTVVDVGCGPGWETAALARRGYEVLGLDLAAAFCDEASARAPGRIARGDMRTLPVATDAVDGVWACASLLHVPRDEVDGTLAEFARALAPGGRLFLSVKLGEGTMVGGSSTYDGDRRQFTLFEREELEARLGTAGFEIASTRVDDERWLVVQAERRA